MNTETPPSDEPRRRCRSRKLSDPSREGGAEETEEERTLPKARSDTRSKATTAIPDQRNPSRCRSLSFSETPSRNSPDLNRGSESPRASRKDAQREGLKRGERKKAKQTGRATGDGEAHRPPKRRS